MPHSLKDSLVVTAVGGGTEVIPFLTVYAVLPLSVAFLVAFSFGSQRFSRASLFYIIVSSFLAFFVAFGLMYPHHDVRRTICLCYIVPCYLGLGWGVCRNMKA